jgi:hypothetical protein
MFGDPGRTRTPNILIRSQVLYPVELRDRWPLNCARRGADASGLKAQHNEVARRIGAMAAKGWAGLNLRPAQSARAA